MSLIKSISGIRGTIGGTPGDNLTPIDIVNSAAAFGMWAKSQNKGKRILIGRDARITGKMVADLCASTLAAMGFDVYDTDLTTTPSIEWAILDMNAAGGIMITASHNPSEWNALKLLNHRGEFISAEDGQKILQLIAQGDMQFSSWNEQGTIQKQDNTIDRHINHIVSLADVNTEAIQRKSFKVVVDCVNSTGAISVIPLLHRLGCQTIGLFDDMSGIFQHDPEPLESHLGELCLAVKNHHADLGIAVDPDVDRLVLVDENGVFFGEEYTIVAIADFLLSKRSGATVSNLSSSRALRDITIKHGGTYFSAAVGEVNVVQKMKEVGAVFGGEGNGGVIYPPSHYGRDAMVGVALILSFMSETDLTLSAIRARYPNYIMTKSKLAFTLGTDIEKLLTYLQAQYGEHDTDTKDGLKVDFPNGWIHLRKSNTEPIFRLYAEALEQATLDAMINEAKQHIENFLNY
jgi:phosphomannomutase